MRRHRSYQNDLDSSLALPEGLSSGRKKSCTEGISTRSRSRYRRSRDVQSAVDRSFYRDTPTKPRPTTPLVGTSSDLLLGGYDADSGIRSLSSPSAGTLSHSLSQGYDTRNDVLLDFTSKDNHLADDVSLNASLTSPHLSSTSSFKRCFGSVPDLQHALHDSEDRRQLLMDKLKDAHNTIKFQARQMNQFENYGRDNSYEIEHLRSRSKEFERKLDHLQSERKQYHDKQIEHLSKREDLQKRLDEQEAEIRMFRNDKESLQSDIKRKQDTIDQTVIAMNILEEENTKLLKAKDNSNRELMAVKESLEITRARNRFLEDNRMDGSQELISLREENKTLTKKSSDLLVQNQKLTATNIALKEENKSLVKNVQSTNKDKSDLLDRLSTLTTNLGEMKAGCMASNIDKERFFRESVDLRTKLHALERCHDELLHTRETAEDKVREMNSAHARNQLEKDKLAEESRQKDDECNAIKKVSEVLSLELSSTKTKVEKMSEQIQCLEQTKMMAARQHQLYEQEISSLESQLEAAKKSLDCSKNEQIKEQDERVQHLIKCKEELRETKSERNFLEEKCSDLEEKLKKSSTMHKEQQDSRLEELDVWKDNCDRLSSTLHGKELEIQTLNKRMEDLQDQVEHLKLNHETHQSQYDELVDCRQEIARLEEDKRRLHQEKAENQQVIQLLEMQKNILAKTSEDHVSRSQDMEKYQRQIEELMQEKKAQQTKIQDLERTRSALLREQEMNSSYALETEGNRVREIESRLEHQQRQLQAALEKNAQLEKENDSLKAREDSMTSRSDTEMLEREKSSLEENYMHLKSQFNDLENRYHQVLTDKGGLFNVDNFDGGKLQIEKQNLESELSKIQAKLVSVENSKAKLEDHNKQMQIRMDELLNSRPQDGDDNSAVLHSQILHLEKELLKSKEEQGRLESQVHSLKDQSLDDVGADLNQMRTELQELMSVIQEKDAAIEVLEQQKIESKKEMTRMRLGTDTQNAGGHLLDDLERELDRVTAEKNSLKIELMETKATIEEKERCLKEELDNFKDKQKRDLRAKDRQIESLEEQLRRSTQVELNKLKRDMFLLPSKIGDSVYKPNSPSRFADSLKSPIPDIQITSHTPDKGTGSIQGLTRWGSDYDFLNDDSSGDEDLAKDRSLWSVYRRGSLGRVGGSSPLPWSRPLRLTDSLGLSSERLETTGNGSLSWDSKRRDWSSQNDVTGKQNAIA